MGTVLSLLSWVSEVEFSRLEVAACGVQADVCNRHLKTANTRQHCNRLALTDLHESSRPAIRREIPNVCFAMVRLGSQYAGMRPHPKPRMGLYSSKRRLYPRRAVRSLLAEPLPALLSASEPLALGHTGTNKEESVAAVPTV